MIRYFVVDWNTFRSNKYTVGNISWEKSIKFDLIIGNIISQIQFFVFCSIGLYSLLHLFVFLRLLYVQKSNTQGNRAGHKGSTNQYVDPFRTRGIVNRKKDYTKDRQRKESDGTAECIRIGS